MTPDEIDALLFRKRKPAIAMLRTREQTGPGTPGCWFGGEPTLPAEIEWPIFEHRDALKIPMHFLVQINLAYVPRVLGLPQLPRSGTLFVFYDAAIAIWWDDGNEMKRGKGARVIYVPDDTTGCPPRTPPPMPDLSHLGMEDVSSDYVDGDQSFVFWPIDFVVVDSYPSYSDDPLIDGFPASMDPEPLDELREKQRDDLDAILGGGSYLKNTVATPGGGHHRIFGATAMNSFPSEEAKRRQGLREGSPTLSRDHILLLRFGLDTQILYQHYIGFWITRSDLANADFSNIRVWENS